MRKVNITLNIRSGFAFRFANLGYESPDRARILAHIWASVAARKAKACWPFSLPNPDAILSVLWTARQGRALPDGVRVVTVCGEPCANPGHWRLVRGGHGLQ